MPQKSPGDSQPAIGEGQIGELSEANPCSDADGHGFWASAGGRKLLASSLSSSGLGLVQVCCSLAVLILVFVGSTFKSQGA